jgi:predicted DNA-binding transcriptional regulator AlpA
VLADAQAVKEKVKERFMEKQQESRESLMQKRLLRFTDLVALGVVKNRATLGNWIKDRGFPRGRLIGPNTRVWNSEDVWSWVDQSVSASKMTPRTGGGRRS